MNKLFFSVSLTLLVLAWERPIAAQPTGTEPMTVALSSPGKPGTLHLKLVSGGIRVVGYSGKEVVIDVAQRADGDRDTPSEPTPPGMRRISKAGGLDVTAQEKENHVYIRTRNPQQSTDFTIKVPQRFSLQIGTVMGGDIVVDNVAGELEVSNVNGSIRLNDVGGSAVLNTVNGELVAGFKDVTPSAPMAFSTVNGKVDVTLPVKTKANLKVKSDQGEVYSDFDLAVDNSAPKVSRTARAGTYRISQDKWTSGKINGGGAEFMMKTLNGNIYIRKAK